MPVCGHNLHWSAGRMLLHNGRGVRSLVNPLYMTVLNLCCGKGGTQRRLIPDGLRRQSPLPGHGLLSVLRSCSTPAA